MNIHNDNTIHPTPTTIASRTSGLENLTTACALLWFVVAKLKISFNTQHNKGVHGVPCGGADDGAAGGGGSGGGWPDN